MPLTFAGTFKEHDVVKNFELSGWNEQYIKTQIKRMYPDATNIKFKEKHESVYEGKFGKPELIKD